MRMLMINLDPEVAEHPDQLVVYGGSGRAARSWAAYDAIVMSLQTLQDDQTLLVQSGKPVGVFDTHEWAPRVLISNSMLVPQWATWEEFRRLEALGLTMYGQMTAGSWIYIGTQGILQGTYETFAAIARKRFHDSLAGTITLTAGLGGMGGAQPLAVTLNGGVAICVEVDPEHIQRRLDHRYLDVRADDVEHALRLALDAKKSKRALSIGLLGNAAEVVPDLAARGFEVDIVTDQTPAHDPLSYVPAGLSPEDAAELRLDAPHTYVRRARAVPGPTSPHLLAGLRRESPRRPPLQRASAFRCGQGADRDWPRSSRCGFRRLALSGDGVHAGRLGRDCRLAHPQRAPQHLERRLVGQRASWRRRRHRSFDPRRHGRGRRRKRAGGEKA